MANSVIFVLSGVIIMEKAILAEGEGAVQGSDWGWLIVIYLCILVIRFASFGLFRCALVRCRGGVEVARVSEGGGRRVVDPGSFVRRLSVWPRDRAVRSSCTPASATSPVISSWLRGVGSEARYVAA